MKCLAGNFSDMADEVKASAPVWERHFQSILTAIVLLLLTWSASTTNDNALQIGIMSANINALTARVVDLKADLNGSVSKDQGSLIELRLKRLEDVVSNHQATAHSK